MIDFEISGAELSSVMHDHVVVRRDDAVFRIEGDGALQCMQGLLTNDLRNPAPETVTYGAVLTPKGMIISDMWVLKQDGALTLIAPLHAREALAQLLKRTMPPRIARVRDMTDASRVTWHYNAPATMNGIHAPSGPAPFHALGIDDASIAGDPAAAARLGDAMMLLHGWPTLRREIDDRTLPQEVRYDELGAVKYDKGCYTGQETVARLHFRGHANRVLRGLTWNSDGVGDVRDVTVSGRSVGSVRTIARVGARLLGLAILRREVELDTSVDIGNSIAQVVPLPFAGELDGQ